MEITTTHHYNFLDTGNSCLQDAYLPAVDRYIFWISGTLLFLATSFLLIGALRFKALRRQPGDLIIGIAFSDWIYSIQWLLQASYPKEVDNQNFCLPIGAIGVFGGINGFLYNTCFSIFLVISLKNVLNQTKIHSRLFHTISLTVSFGYVIGLLISDNIGRNLGVCAIKFDCNMGLDVYTEILWLFFTVLYVLLGVFTFFYVRKNLSNCARISSKRAEFLNYYKKYNIVSSGTYLIIAASNVLIILVAVSNYSKLYIWANPIYNLSKLGSLLFLTVMRYKDPAVKPYMLKTIFFWRKDDERGDILTSLVSGRTSQHEATVVHHSFRPDNDFRIDSFSSDMKMGLTYTLLSCVLYASKVHGRERRDSMKSSYKQEKVFFIEEKAIFADIPGVQQELARQDLNIFPGTLKIYAPGVFAEFVEQDKEFINIANALDLQANREQILNAGRAQGGRGGGFFFFSKDKTLILKTLTSEELRMVIKILKRYDEHFKEYPDSLIAKIYGVYTYENADLGVRFNMMLIKNVCGFPSQFVTRVYDLKGSTYQRQIVKDDEELSEAEMRKKVLKDLDFERFEKTLKISPGYKPTLLKQLAADSNFFRAVNLIDYSFMIFFVDKAEAYEEIDVESDFTAKNSLASIQSTSQLGMYYNMGIIDYLQPYTSKKKMERCMKRLRKMDPNLDTSSQNSEYYSERFIAFMKKILGAENQS